MYFNYKILTRTFYVISNILLKVIIHYLYNGFIRYNGYIRMDLVNFASVIFYKN